MRLLCRLFGHDTAPWEKVPDRFLARQFDPSGIHWLHSHYRPDARWPVIARFGLLKKFQWKANCRRCGSVVWEFDPNTLDGREWGQPDAFGTRKEALEFEARFYGVPIYRA